MILSNATWNLKMDLLENQVILLVVESPSIMTDIVLDFLCINGNEESNFTLSENNKILNLNKEIDVIINPYKLDFHSRKIMQQLYNNLKTVSIDEDEKKAEINIKALQLLDIIIEKSGFCNLTYDLDLQWENLFKLYQIHIDDSFESLEEQLEEYIKISANLLKTRILCFINLKSFLEPNQIKHLYTIAFYCKVHLILIESKEYEKIDSEKIYIIDKDNCLIIK